MADAGRRGMPLLSGRAPSPDPSVPEGACRKCNKEFNLIFSRSRKCNHCDYQALMPRSGHDQSGYDPMHVCGFCIEFLQVTAAGKAQLKAMPLSKLKKYVTAYNIKIDRAVEKDDLIDGIIAAKGPDGCLMRANEVKRRLISLEKKNFYRKYSVPNRATGARSRGLFSRPSQGTSPSSNNPSPRPTTSSYQEFPRPDLAPDDPPAHSHSQPQGTSWRAPSGPPPPPPPPPPPQRPQPQQPQYNQAPPPNASTYPGSSPYSYTPPYPQAQSHPYSQTGPGHGSGYHHSYNAGYNPGYAPYTPHGAYPPPPHPPPRQDHYYAGQSAPPPPPPRETRPPPPPPNPNVYPNRPSAPPSSTNSMPNTSAPRARTASTAPPPVPTLDELLEMTSESIRALSISTLKAVLFANHVGAGQILEKSDLVNKVLVLVEDEKRERARAREAEELERITREAEREERDRDRRLNEERVQREREEHERERDQARDTTSSSAQDDGLSGSSRPTSPPNPPPKTEEATKPSAFASAKSHAAAHLERTGLCVICQDEEANIAIVDCGGCSELVMSSSRECPLCRTRIVTEARLLRIFKT
ncbi:hypothetical protein BJ165DRAFT_1401056 [Panaeolus papilionaceus]|nr:hypothetical protein BJ165DRAFT_1401056 [Panaeolus papilionaceus]